MPIWSHSMEVGIARVDAQHKQLVEKITELQTAMREARGKEVVGSIVDFLGKYVIEHFSTEETLMRMHGYPDYEKHLALHAGFKKEFAELSAKLKAGEVGNLISIQVQSKLSDWLVNHIMNVDRMAGAYLVGKGVA